MVGFGPTTRKTHGPADGAIYQGISGVLDRLTTFKRLTNSLPKLSLIAFATRQNCSMNFNINHLPQGHSRTMCAVDSSNTWQRSYL